LNNRILVPDTTHGQMISLSFRCVQLSLSTCGVQITKMSTEGARHQIKGGIYMKLGVSSYSFLPAIKSGEMSIFDVMDWIKENGGEHIEMVPIGFTLDDNQELVEEIRTKAASLRLDISNYAIGANFMDKTEKDYRAEIERVKKQVDIAHELGTKNMRHDVASRNPSEATIIQFQKDLPAIVNACKEIADYAAQYGITTSVENHGYHVQHADRVHQIVDLVDKENFKTTLDIGNFLCVDEDPLSAVKRNITIASMVHFKDFYVRPYDHNPGRGWFSSAAGNYLRGAIVGQGDIHIPHVMKAVKESSYDGYLSLEFEGMEDCRMGIQIGLENMKRIWDEV